MCGRELPSFVVVGSSQYKGRIVSGDWFVWECVSKDALDNESGCCGGDVVFSTFVDEVEGGVCGSCYCGFILKGD
jgi:hypothetical protein